MKTLKTIFMTMALGLLVQTASAQTCALFGYWSSGLTLNVYDSNYCPSSVPSNSTWYFGDSTLQDTGQFVTHNYIAAGTYYVTMSVHDASWSFIQDSTIAITVGNTPVRCASFSSSNSFNVVTFTNTSTCVGATSYNWIFGDGTTSSATNPVHTYGTAGSYMVILVVSDSNSVILDSASSLVTVTMPPPAACQALFIKSQARDSSNNPIPGHVVITDQSTGSGLSYLWDFGDSTTSTLQNPTHTYTGNGPYVLCLTVSDSGCNSTFCDTLSVDSNGIVHRSAQGFTVHVGGYNPSVGISKIESGARLKAYPNPLKDELNLSISGLAEGKVEFRILNEMGQIVSLNYLMVSGNNVQHNIDVRQLEKGLYILQLTSENEVLTTKLIKN